MDYPKTGRMPRSIAFCPIFIEREYVLESIGAGRDLVTAALADLRNFRLLQGPSLLSILLKNDSVVVETVARSLLPLAGGGPQAIACRRGSVRSQVRSADRACLLIRLTEDLGSHRVRSDRAVHCSSSTSGHGEFDERCWRGVL
jgi:hypothetical protein